MQKSTHTSEASTSCRQLLLTCPSTCRWDRSHRGSRISTLSPRCSELLLSPVRPPCSRPAAAFSQGAGRGQQLSAAGASSQIPPAQGTQPSSRPPFHSHPSSTILGVHCWGGWCSGFVCKAEDGRSYICDGG